MVSTEPACFGPLLCLPLWFIWFICASHAWGLLAGLSTDGKITSVWLLPDQSTRIVSLLGFPTCECSLKSCDIGLVALVCSILVSIGLMNSKMLRYHWMRVDAIQPHKFFECQKNISPCSNVV